MTLTQRERAAVAIAARLPEGSGNHGSHGDNGNSSTGHKINAVSHNPSEHHARQTQKHLFFFFTNICVRLTVEEKDGPGDTIDGGGACDPTPSPTPAPPCDFAATAAAIAIAADGACCAEVTAADTPPLTPLAPPPQPPPIPPLLDAPLVSTGIIAVSGNRLSPGPGPPGGWIGARAAASSGEGVLSPELLIPGSLGNGASGG